VDDFRAINSITPREQIVPDLASGRKFFYFLHYLTAALSLGKFAAFSRARSLQRGKIVVRWRIACARRILTSAIHARQRKPALESFLLHKMRMLRNPAVQQFIPKTSHAHHSFAAALAS
jgi:hypothetical protein